MQIKEFGMLRLCDLWFERTSVNLERMTIQNNDLNSKEERFSENRLFSLEGTCSASSRAIITA
jgi:hypothetical protein